MKIQLLNLSPKTSQVWATWTLAFTPEGLVLDKGKSTEVHFRNLHPKNKAIVVRAIWKRGVEAA